MARAWGATRKLPSGRWQARYRGPDGKEYTGPVTYRRKREAGEWLDSQHALIGAEKWVPPNRRDKEAAAAAVTIGEAVPRWLEDLERAGRKPKTIANYYSRMKVAVLPTMAGRPLSQLTRADVELWWSSYAAATTDHPSAKRSAFMSLRALCSWAVQRDILPGNPCVIPGAAVHHPVKETPWGHVLTPEQVAACHAAMPADNAVAVSLAAWCQLREGEVLGLHVGDIDLKAGLLTVERQVQSLVGQGMVEMDPKSDAGKRVIAVPSQVLSELARHIEEYSGPTYFMPRRGHPDEYLHPNTFRNRWQTAAGQAGFKGFVFHDLRHTGLTIYAQQGATAAELLHRGGHSSLEVALRYQHATIERDRMLVEELEKIIV